MASGAKAQAIAALEDLLASLDAEGTRTPLELAKLRVTASYAKEQVEQIQEVKRIRRSTGGPA